MKSSISTLDSSIKATEGSSGGWETFGWLCAIAVGVGVTGEIVVIVAEHLDDLEDWRRGIVRPPDKPPGWRFWFDIIATLLVVAGVFGEAGASSAIASINSHLRSKTSELRGKSAQLLAVITEEAGDAATSATSAEASATAAGTKAGEAKSKADAASVSAGKAQEKIGRALTSLSELQARIAWRTVSDEQRKELKDRLKAFPGRTVILSWSSIEPEQNAFGPQLLDALHNAGLNVEPNVSAMDILPPAEMAITGMLIEGSDEVFIQGLAKALACSSLAPMRVPAITVSKPDGSVNLTIRPRGQIIINNKNAAACKN